MTNTLRQHRVDILKYDPGADPSLQIYVVLFIFSASLLNPGSDFDYVTGSAMSALTLVQWKLKNRHKQTPIPTEWSLPYRGTIYTDYIS